MNLPLFLLLLLCLYGQSLPMDCILKGKVSVSGYLMWRRGLLGCPPDTVTPHFLHWAGATAETCRNTHSQSHKLLQNTDNKRCVCVWVWCVYIGVVELWVPPSPTGYTSLSNIYQGGNAITKKPSQVRRQKAEPNKTEWSSAEIYFMVWRRNISRSLSRSA